MPSPGAMDNKGGHELITDVGRDVSTGSCEVMDLTSAITRKGRLTGKLIPGGPCVGGLEVPPELNHAVCKFVEATSHDTLDIIGDTTGK